MSFHAGAMGGVGTLVSLILVLLPIAGMWKMFTKAGRPGWAAIIPFYNLYVLVQVGEKEWWWFLIFLIPLVNLVALFVVNFAVAEHFGKDKLYGLLLVFLPFIGYPLLGFGDAQYQGSTASGNPGKVTPPGAQ